MLDAVPKRNTSRAFALALSRSREWRHRRVESLWLMEDQVGRRRVSIDCTPPPAPELAYEQAERKRADITKVAGPIMVPLGFIAKGPMRALDISSAAGAVPILGRTEYRFLLVGALEYELEPATCRRQRHNLRRALEVIVDGPLETSERVAGELLDSGRYANYPVLKVAEISARAADLLTELSQRFILVGLVPSALAGTRTVIKYSYHWRTHPLDNPASAVTRVLTAVGLRSMPVLIEVGRPSDDRSFHLEVHAPFGLQCSGLQLADGGRDPSLNPRNLRDTSDDVVAHAVGNYKHEPSDPDAVLQLAVADSGLRLMTFLVSLFTALSLALGLWAEGAKETITSASNGAAGLLLAIPAVVIALLVRPGENRIAGQVLAPLRLVILVCAGTLLGVAGSIVGSLDEPWLNLLWHAGLIVPVMALLGLAAGYVSGFLKTRRSGWSTVRRTRDG